MQKIVVHRPGGYDRLVIETHPEPVPGPGDVLVETEAVGVNFADCVVRMGLYESAKKYVGWPITPGFELAGRVKAVGPEVSGFGPGDRVCGLTRFGAYATEVVVPRRQLFHVPEGLTVPEAAAFFVVHLTAWYALRELVRLRPGKKILVHSAAGGVGGALVQIGKISGCTVVGVVGAPHKVVAARERGADHVIDKSSEDLWRQAERHAPDGYDVVLDANGVETLRRSFRALGPTGKLVVYGFHTMLVRGGSGRPSYPKLAIDYLKTPRFDPIRLTNENKAVLGFNLSYLFDEMDLLEEASAELLSWLRAGKLRPPTVTERPFEEVAEAHRALESGATVGKLVLLT